MTTNFDAAQIADILTEKSAPWQPAEAIRIVYGAFEGQRAKYGSAVNVDMATWAQSRQEAAYTPHTGDKSTLPAEVGALLAVDGAGVRRRAQDVLAPTWVFVDTDDARQSGTTLRHRLMELQIAFLMTESFTSRHNGNGAKWHLFLPLSQPKTFSSRNLPGIDARATLEARKDWWRRVCDHVKRALFTLGELTQEQDESHDEPRADDDTADTLARMAYVPRVPDGKTARHLYWQPGHCLDLDAFLSATGFTEIEPPTVRVEDAPAQSKRTTQRPDKGAHDMEEAADDGPTAGETTGTLLYKALDFFGFVGPEVAPGKFKALCPWRGNHTPSDTHDPQGFLDGDTSVTFWLHDDDGKPGGGWKCQHHGGGITGQCAQSTASDVLRWARKHGCPLPDSTAWGAFVATSAPPAAASPAAVEPPPEFPGALKVSEPLKPPLPRAAMKAEPVEIEITENLAGMRDLAIKAIGSHPAFFVTERGLFDLVEQDGLDKFGNPKRPWLRKTLAPHLRAELGTVSNWYVLNHKGQKVASRPDREIAGIVAAAGLYPGVRELNGIITTPVFRRDFTLIQSPGYDDRLGVIYRPGCHVPLVSASPGRAQLAQAKASLMRVIRDFPFKAGTVETARGVWLSAIFTRLLRFTFSGNVPLYAVSAGDAGSGKGKLIDAASIISEGTEAWKRTKSGDDAEVERAIGAAIKEEVPIAVLDNIPRGTALESATLDAYLTTPRFATREIGTSKNITAVKGGWCDTLWWATGNGLQTGGDISRRLLRVDIDDRSGDPTRRRSDILNLEKHCHQHRPELLAAALTLLSGFFAARKAGWSVELPPFASFADWSIVREAIVWCGLPDPYEARGKADDDVDGADFARLMRHLHAFAGDKPVWMGKAAQQLKTDYVSKTPKHAACYNFLVDSGVKLAGDGASNSLGRYLHKFKGKTQRMPDGKLVQLHLGKDEDGSFFRLDAVG